VSEDECEEVQVTITTNDEIPNDAVIWIGPKGSDYAIKIFTFPICLIGENDRPIPDLVDLAIRTYMHIIKEEEVVLAVEDCAEVIN
jgi:hypothetical protein